MTAARARNGLVFAAGTFAAVVVSGGPWPGALVLALLVGVPAALIGTRR